MHPSHPPSHPHVGKCAARNFGRLQPIHLLDTAQNGCAILNPERELQPSPNRPIRYRLMGHGAEPAGTMSRIDTPALDARQGCGADSDASRDVRPRKDVRSPLQPNRWRRLTPRGGMPLAFPMSLPSLPFGLGYGSSVAAGNSPPWPRAVAPSEDRTVLQCTGDR